MSHAKGNVRARWRLISSIPWADLFLHVPHVAFDFLVQRCKDGVVSVSIETAGVALIHRRSGHIFHHGRHDV